MTHVINVTGHKIEAGCLIEAGSNFHATVQVQASKAVGLVRAVGYVFDESFSTQVAAMEAAEKFGSVSSRPSRPQAGDVPTV